MSDKNQSLEERMHLAQNGDNAAYANLLDECSHILRGYLMKKLSASPDVEDIVQEILISLHKARHTYDKTRPFKPWLFAIAKFRLNDYLRKAYKKVDNEAGYFEEISNEISQDIENDVTNLDDEHERLYEAIDELPEKQKKIIHLMKVEGYTAKEVGQQLNMNESAVKVTAHRTYKALKKKIQSNS